MYFSLSIANDWSSHKVNKWEGKEQESEKWREQKQCYENSFSLRKTHSHNRIRSVNLFETCPKFPKSPSLPKSLHFMIDVWILKESNLFIFCIFRKQQEKKAVGLIPQRENWHFLIFYEIFSSFQLTFSNVNTNLNLYSI